MQEAEHDLTSMAFESSRGSSNSRFADDDKLFVQFSVGSVQNTQKTAQEGRPIFDDVDMIKIIVPGNTENTIHRVVRPTDKHRFPKQHAAFLEGREHKESGTPLKMWTLITRSQVDELAHFKIYTVENLANLSDESASRFAGLATLREHAKAFLAAATETAPLVALQALADTQKEQLEANHLQMAKLSARIDELEGD